MALSIVWFLPSRRGVASLFTSPVSLIFFPFRNSLVRFLRSAFRNSGATGSCLSRDVEKFEADFAEALKYFYTKAGMAIKAEESFFSFPSLSFSLIDRSLIILCKITVSWKWFLKCSPMKMFVTYCRFLSFRNEKIGEILEKSDLSWTFSGYAISTTLCIFARFNQEWFTPHWPVCNHPFLFQCQNPMRTVINSRKIWPDDRSN